MSRLPPAESNIRRSDSPWGGQTLLLVAAVATSAVFSCLYISAKTGGGDSAPPVPPAPAAGVPEPKSAAGPATGGEPKYEPTEVVVEQVLVASTAPGAPPEKIIARTPAVYQTGTLQWNPEQTARARDLQAKLGAVTRHQEALDHELARLEAEWRELVRLGTPASALRVDSPSVPAAVQPAP